VRFTPSQGRRRRQGGLRRGALACGIARCAGLARSAALPGSAQSATSLGCAALQAPSKAPLPPPAPRVAMVPWSAPCSSGFESVNGSGGGPSPISHDIRTRSPRKDAGASVRSRRRSTGPCRAGSGSWAPARSSGMGRRHAAPAGRQPGPCTSLHSLHPSHRLKSSGSFSDHNPSGFCRHDFA